MSIIEKDYELEAYFHNAGKPREQWRVGTEYEKVGIDRSTGKAIPYFGPRGVDRAQVDPEDPEAGYRHHFDERVPRDRRPDPFRAGDAVLAQEPQ